MHTKTILHLSLVAMFMLAGCSRANTPTALPPSPTLPPATTVPSTALPPTALALPTVTPVPPAPPSVPTIAVLPTITPAPTSGSGSGAAQPTATAALVATNTPKATVDMRKLDWEKVVTTDPALVYNKAESDKLNADFKRGPYVTIKGSDVSGFALLKDMSFGDISGDGQEEAVIVLESGGTGGAFGVVLFGVVEGKPKMIEKVLGYKMFAKIEKGELIIPQPVYAGWEANCCPSGQSTTKYILSGTKLVQTGYTDSPFEQAKEPTVGEFYNLLVDKKYAEAYKFFSPALQVAMPFEKWRDGYKNTTFSPKPPEVNVTPKGQVKAEVVAFEKTDNGEIRSTYEVLWTLVWSSKSKQWLLDSANAEIATSVPSLNSVIRTTNWFKVLTSEPKLKYDSSVNGKDLGFPGPFLTAENQAYGHAMLESIRYGDISGDGREEAVIPLHSGGTAGTTGMLVYTMGPDGKPRFISAMPGYKMGATIQAGEMQITLPIYAGWEPNCCPSGSSTIRYKLDAATLKLTLLGEKSGPLPESHVGAVNYFYDLLSAKNYKDAYAMFSPAFQASQPFDKWQAGYQNTKILSVKTNLVDANRVRVELNSQEGSNNAQKFFITWSLVWNNEKGWKLDKAVVQ
ncbi:MAG: hypothetical protein KIH69_018140 [Anaerolineae bacterium]|nr:hypothetical protein [Anaerolineae bacterium]